MSRESQAALPFLDSGAVLAAELPAKNAPRCEGKLLTAEARTSRTGRPPFDRCPHTAKYVVSGHSYCKMHSGKVALIALLDMQE